MGEEERGEGEGRKEKGGGEGGWFQDPALPLKGVCSPLRPP